jgi:hypothetical protein
MTLGALEQGSAQHKCGLGDRRERASEQGRDKSPCHDVRARLRHRVVKERLKSFPCASSSYSALYLSIDFPLLLSPTT